MTRTQVQQLIVIVLLIAFGAIWAATRKGGAPGPSPAVTTSPAPKQPPSRGRGSEVPLEEEAGAEASLARDLFRLPSRLLQKIREREQAQLQQQQPPPTPAVTPEAPVEPPPEFSSLELQGVFWGAGRPQAIINRKILSVGDTIEGAQVTAITKEGVTLTYGEQQVELKPSSEIRSGRDGEGASQGSSFMHEH